jgi:hypothetical protein
MRIVSATPLTTFWRELNAPATMELSWSPLTTYTPPSGFSASIGRRPESSIPSYPLQGYKAVWEVWDDDDHVVGCRQTTHTRYGSKFHSKHIMEAPTLQVGEAPRASLSAYGLPRRRKDVCVVEPRSGD